MSLKDLTTSTARKLKHRDIRSPLISKYLVQIRPRAFSVALGHLQFSLASALTAHQFHKSGPCFKLNT